MVRCCIPKLPVNLLADFFSLSFFLKPGCLNFVDENDEVLISGFGRKGKAKGDIPGVSSSCHRWRSFHRASLAHSAPSP